MNGTTLVILELGIILGGVLMFALWELRALKRNKKS